jgi:FkbM family methyltransferase
VGRQLERTGALVGAVTRNRIRSHDVLVDTSSRWISNATRAALFWGFYEGAERRAIERYLRPELDVVELGASIGFLSVLIARKARGRKLVAVEANPELIPILERNLSANGVREAQVVNQAVAYGADRVPFQLLHDTASGHIAARESHGDDIRYVPATTLGRLVESRGLKDFALVCDVEGAEYEIFAHEGEAVRRMCRQAIMELHAIERNGRHWSREELADHLSRQWGMQIVHGDGKVWVFEAARGART